MTQSKTKLLKKKFDDMLPFLNEKQRRVFAAAEARAYGRGGIKIVADISGISRQTIYRGLTDLDSKIKDLSIRQPGGGRKRLSDSEPSLIEAIEGLIEPSLKGDPESLLRWTCKSTRNLESELKDLGFNLSYRTVSRVLHELDYNLHGNRKSMEGKKDHPDRNEQFEYINSLSKKFVRNGHPVISVDTKKKELIGNYKNSGREWRKKGTPIDVLSHDFPDPALPKAVPYGVYDIEQNIGWINVGIDGDTAEFAVESIRQWWKRMGKKTYQTSKKLLIFADSGGSNSYRSHLWKHELQKFCDKEKVQISVSHFPPGTSKWNKIEHRLFSFVSMNWRGQPLLDYMTIVNLIANTKTTSGLKVAARLDTNNYERGIKLTKQEIESVNIKRHEFHGDWNYTIKPRQKILERQKASSRKS